MGQGEEKSNVLELRNFYPEKISDIKTEGGIEIVVNLEGCQKHSKCNCVTLEEVTVLFVQLYHEERRFFTNVQNIMHHYMSTQYVLFPTLCPTYNLASYT